MNDYTRINPFKKMGVELRHLHIDGYGLTNIKWEMHPRVLEKVLRKASRLNLPLIITENGTATHDAQRKADYMKRHVDVVERYLQNGIDGEGTITGRLSTTTSGSWASMPGSACTVWTLKP